MVRNIKDRFAAIESLERQEKANRERLADIDARIAQYQHDIAVLQDDRRRLNENIIRLVQQRSKTNKRHEKLPGYADFERYLAKQYK